MNARIDTKKIAQMGVRLNSAYNKDGQPKVGPKYDFRNEANYDQDFVGIGERLADMAAKKWGGTKSLSDAQITQGSIAALTQTIAGFYMKPALETFWSGGQHITITDAGVLPGMNKAEWLKIGRRSKDPNDGITAPNQPPQRSVDIAMEYDDGRLYDVKKTIYLTRRDIQRGEAVGYDAFALKSGELRKDHMQDLNNLIRRGNLKFGIRGMVNYPGIRHRTATANWDSDTGDVIYADYNGAINEIYVSPTEEAMPAVAVLARNQYRHLQTENQGLGTDTTLKTYIEVNNEGHEIMVDPGMATADPLGGPGALFFTPRPDLVRVIAPEWMQMLPPHDEDAETISITIVSRILGPVITDEESVLFVDGTPAGWTSGF